MIQDLIKEHQAKLLKTFDIHFEKAIKKLGFTFNSKEKLYDFCRNRIIKVNSGYKNYVYLDYKDKTNKGILLFIWFDKVDISFDGNTVTMKQYFHE